MIIGEYAFSGCKGLTEIIIPKSVHTIENYAFSNCEELTQITSLSTTAPTLKYNEVFSSMNTIGKLIVPIGSAESYVLNFMERPTNWWSMANMKWLLLEKDNYVYEDGLYYSKDSKILYAADRNLTGEVYIKEGVETIWYYAFNGCESISMITIPQSMKRIKPYSFYYCSSLRQITSLATIAPTREELEYYNDYFFVPENGTLIIPPGCTDEYYYWGEELDGWTIQEATE